MKCVICGTDIGDKKSIEHKMLVLPFLVDEVNGAVHRELVPLCDECTYELACVIEREVGLRYKAAEDRVCSE